MIADEDLKFYLARLQYYRERIDRGLERANGFGEILFELDREGIIQYYEFWKDAMIRAIERAKCKVCPLKKKEKK